MNRIKSALEARMLNGKKEDAGFSLIELLVVVIIIGILAAIAIPIYIGVQNNAKDSAVKSDLTNAKIAVVAYYTDKASTVGVVPAPALTKASLGDYGFTTSPDTTAIAFKTAPTQTAFCIDATSSTTKKFKIDQATGATEGSC